MSTPFSFSSIPHHGRLRELTERITEAHAIDAENVAQQLRQRLGSMTPLIEFENQADEMKPNKRYAAPPAGQYSHTTKRHRYDDGTQVGNLSENL